MRRRGLSIFWPAYFDSTRTRKMGRRLPKDLCTAKPIMADLFKAAKKAGFYVEADKISKYPKTWFDHPGLIMVDIKDQPKNTVLKKLAPHIKKIQSVRKASTQLKKIKKKKGSGGKKQNIEALLKEKLASKEK